MILATVDRSPLWIFLLCSGLVVNLLPKLYVRLHARGVVRGKEPTVTEDLILRLGGLGVIFFSLKMSGFVF